jgi:hypothetical protein
VARNHKLLAAFLRATTAFPWRRFERLLNVLGYDELPRGRTSGSRRRFINRQTGHKIFIHEPHDGVMTRSLVRRLKNNFRENGIL